MLNLRAPIVALLGICLSTAGCLAEPVGSDSEQENIASTEQEWIIMNGSAPNFLWQGDVQSTLKWLAAHPLLDAAGELQDSLLFDTPEGRLLMEHIVTCALPKDAFVKNTAANFYATGALGLAKDWKDVPLDWQSGQRWMTACILQTLNGVGKHIKINATGYAIGDSGEDTSEYVFPDMIAFGNMFGPASKVYACYLKPLEAACGAATSIYATDRICDTSPTCGLTLLGSCEGDKVCDTDDKGNSKCSAYGDDYIEAIMTTLQKDGAQALYPECSM